MAYRVKGYLTKKQRKDAEDLIRSYHSLLSSPSCPETLRTLVEGVLLPWVTLLGFALYVDNQMILNKIISRGASSG